MVLLMFAVNDVKANAFSAPFFTSTKGLAVRMFSDLAKDSRSSLSKYPDDFKLYLIGEFNDASGAVDSHKPEFICSGSEFVSNSITDSVIKK